jgi:hypothetical protein
MYFNMKNISKNNCNYTSKYIVSQYTIKLYINKLRLTYLLMWHTANFLVNNLINKAEDINLYMNMFVQTLPNTILLW